MASKKSPRRVSLVGNPEALDALSSPARQELLSALGNGPATVGTLSERLGRSRQALYYHVGLLVDAGLVRPEGEGGSGRDRERVYALVADRVAVGARAGSSRERAAADRAVGAMLRLTAREVRSALESGVERKPGARRELMALRAKTRLAPEELARLNSLLDEVEDLLARAKGRPTGGRLLSLTIVLTPSRESGALDRKRNG